MSVAKRLNREHPASVARDNVEYAHRIGEHDRVIDGWLYEGGRWPVLGDPECDWCLRNRAEECATVAAALADIFSPRAADFVPRGFGRRPKDAGYIDGLDLVRAYPATPSGGKAN